MLTEEDQEFLQHYGVLGMKWGVRRSQAQLDRAAGRKTQRAEKRQAKKEAKENKPKMTPQEKKRMIRNISIAMGTLTVAAGAAIASHHLRKNGNKKVSDLNTSSKIKEKVQDTFVPPTEIFLATRGKNTGFKFQKTGGAPDPMSVFDRVGEINPSTDRPGDGLLKRIGDNNELIASVFNDPEGRKDRAGRIIPHTVVIPKSMTEGINNVEDVTSKIWPMIKDDYQYE